MGRERGSVVDTGEVDEVVWPEVSELELDRMESVGDVG